MKRLMSKLACAALGLGLCFGSAASASIPVAMAPSASHPGTANLVSSRVIIIIVVVTRPEAARSLEHVDQTAEFDRVN